MSATTLLESPVSEAVIETTCTTLAIRAVPVPTDPIPDPIPPADFNTTFNAAVAANEREEDEIAGLCIAKYADEGERNFAIGSKTFYAAVRRKTHFESTGKQKATDDDFDALVNSVITKVRLSVNIKPKSIRVAEWTRCYVLRDLVSRDLGDGGADLAKRVSFHEYVELQRGTRALSFDKGDVSGELRLGWMDFIKSIISRRSNGVRVSSQEFDTEIATVDARIKASKKTAAEVAVDALKDERRKTQAKQNAVTDSITDALTTGIMSPDQVLATLETVAKQASLSLPSSIGFDPAKCTMQDIDTLADALFANGKHAEMKRLAARLAKHIERMDIMRATVESQRHAATVRLQPAMSA